MKYLHVTKSIKFQLAVSLVLIVLGIGMFALRDSNALIHAEPSAPPVSASVWKPTKPATIQGNPVHLDLPSLGLSLPVINGVYNAKLQTWTLSSDKVQYATVTPPPNTADGNTFLYGHYRKGVFSSLHTIHPGDQARITTDNGHTFTYTFVSSREVKPSDTSVFNHTDAPTLTIQTCSGLFYQNRQLFTFSFKGVK